MLRFVWNMSHHLIWTSQLHQVVKHILVKYIQFNRHFMVLIHPLPPSRLPASANFLSLATSHQYANKQFWVGGFESPSCSSSSSFTDTFYFMYDFFVSSGELYVRLSCNNSTSLSDNQELLPCILSTNRSFSTPKLPKLFPLKYSADQTLATTIRSWRYHSP